MDELRQLDPGKYKIKMHPELPDWEQLTVHGFQEWNFKTDMKSNYKIRDNKERFLLFITDPIGAFQTKGSFTTLDEAKEAAEVHYFKAVAELFKKFKLSVWVSK